MEKADNTRLSDRKRESILDAAVQEFGASGFDNTSMDRISDVANVSKRTVYNHFPSKQDLFIAIVERLISRCNSLEEHTYDPHKSLEQQLRDIAQSYLHLANSEEFKGLARVILPRFLQTPELSKQLLGGSRPGERAFISWVKSAQMAGQLKPGDPFIATRQFRGIIDTFAFWPQILGSESPLTKSQQTEIIQSTVEIFLSYYATV
jgi:TetR/AcrR family transcriptional regulator of autoinduction and epiphytic fitness